jgi:hypothetical protein
MEAVAEMMRMIYFVHRLHDKQTKMLSEHKQYRCCNVANLNIGMGWAWAPQGSAVGWPQMVPTAPSFDLGGNHGGVLATGSKTQNSHSCTSLCDKRKFTISPPVQNHCTMLFTVSSHTHRLSWSTKDGIKSKIRILGKIWTWHYYKKNLCNWGYSGVGM